MTSKIEMYDIYNDNECRPEHWTLNLESRTIKILTVDSKGKAHTEKLTDVGEEDMRIQRARLQALAARERRVGGYRLEKVFGR